MQDMQSFKNFALRRKKEEEDDLINDIIETCSTEEKSISDEKKWIYTQKKWLEMEKKYLSQEIAKFKHEKENMKCEVCEERKKRKQ